MPQMTTLRKRLLSVTLIWLTAALWPATAAYPERPVTLVVTYPPGGTADLVARLLAPEVAKELGQNIVVENRGGAGGMIGGIGSGFLWQSVGPGWTLTGSSLVCLLGLLLALRAGSAPVREQA